MTPLAEVVLRSSAVLAVALLALPLLRRRSAALRHGVLVAALVASALAVPLNRAAPGWSVPLTLDAATGSVPLPLANAPAASGGAVRAPRPDFDVATFAQGLWGLGAVVLLAWLALSVLRLARLAARAAPVTDERWVRISQRVAADAGLRRLPVLLQTDVPGLVATFGLREPRLLVPVQAGAWSDERITAVLRHELAHVQRHDWPVQLVAAALTACYWFNPLFWLASRRLRLESERACDDAVLRGGVDAAEYAQHLLGIARMCRPSHAHLHGAMSIVRPSTLRRRITAMLHSDSARDAVSRRSILLVAGLTLALALPVATIRGERAGALPLAGFVYDASGAVLPGATLTLEAANEQRWEAVSDSSGRFEFAPVEAGRYQLHVGVPGFRQLTETIELARERDWHRAITLQVGSVRETITVREQRLAGAAPEAAEPVRVRVGGNVRPPRKLRDVKPVYPESMREAGLEGVVPLEALIDRSGEVRSIRVLTAAVHPDLARAATDAVRQWRFDPTLLNGEPVEVVMTVTVNFELEGE